MAARWLLLERGKNQLFPFISCLTNLRSSLALTILNSGSRRGILARLLVTWRVQRRMSMRRKHGILWPCFSRTIGKTKSLVRWASRGRPFSMRRKSISASPRVRFWARRRWKNLRLLQRQRTLTRSRLLMLKAQRTFSRIWPSRTSRRNARRSNVANPSPWVWWMWTPCSSPLPTGLAAPSA